MYLVELIRKFVYFQTYHNLKRCGKNVLFSRGGVIKRPEELSIGDNVFISTNFHISARSMKIGSNVIIGPNFLAECDDHIFNRVGRTIYSTRTIRNIDPIIIENDVWIGGSTAILKGVTIHEGSIIGAKSLVTKSMPPYSICYGSPCRPVRKRFSDIELQEHLKKTKSKYTLSRIKKIWERTNLK